MFPLTFEHLLSRAATSFSDPDLTWYFMLLLLECQAFPHNLKLDARQNINRQTTGRRAQAGGAVRGVRSVHVAGAASLSRDFLQEWGLGAAGRAGNVAGVSGAVLTLTAGSFPQGRC